MTTPVRSLARRVSLLGLLAPGTLPAQAVLSGTVRDDSTGAPLAGVEVLLNTTSFKAETNAQGRFVLGGLPAGTYQVIYRLLGHLPVRLDVTLRPGDTTRANASLIKSAVVLNPVIVTGEAETTRGVGLGREAFEERRRLGFGRFFDAATLREFDGHLHLDHLVSRYAGVALAVTRVDGVTGYLAMNATRRGIDGRLNYSMQIYYNGAPVGRGGIHSTRPTNLRMFDLTGLDAVEVYRRPAEVPQEYGGSNAACGVILLWSRVKP